MENKINIAELLKDCPKGMELDCTIFSGLEFDRIDENNGSYPIICRTKTTNGKYHVHTFTKHGCYSTEMYSKCVIYPKGKTTWEGFVPPCKFKDGDIIADEHGNIAIYKGTMWYNKKLAGYYCGYRKSDNHFLPEPKRDGHFGVIEELHHATEEEKEKLFQAIKDNGYKWNAETKTLDKLIEPSFKVGDKVRHKNNHGVVFTITSIEEDYYVCGVATAFWFDDQDDYELAPSKFDITTLIPFESRVLARYCKDSKWIPTFWGSYDKEDPENPYNCCGMLFAQCIPYEGNEHLLGTTYDCDTFYKTWK